jgi:hypothetical protein
MRNAEFPGRVRQLFKELEPRLYIPHSTLRIPHYAFRARPTLASTPVAASATISDERPYDMNGKVTPVAGITARLTPI